MVGKTLCPKLPGQSGQVASGMGVVRHALAQRQEELTSDPRNNEDDSPEKPQYSCRHVLFRFHICMYVPP